MAPQHVSFHLPRLALWLIGALVLAPWLVIASWLARTPWATSGTAVGRAAPLAVHATAKASQRDAAPAVPWGELEYSRIMIEPPEEFVADAPNPPILPWIFKGFSEEDLLACLRSAGLTEAQIGLAMSADHCERRADGVVVKPTRELIVGLTPAARSKVYAVLGQWPENVAQFNPFRLRTTFAGDWLNQADFPPEAIALTKRLFYQRGTATCFSDASVVLPMIHDASQRIHYLKALSRKSALMVYLRIRPGQEVDSLAAYWGRGGRTKDLRPLLQSLARTPEGGRVDIVHLVPRFVRLLAYTYPLPSERPIDANHDCHWTSFNFQNDQPDERFSNIDYVRQVLMDQYYPVMGPPLLGDIIMFVRKDGVVLHSCVYIADDIVFTKNGPAYSVPWLFSPLADVQAYYSDTPGIEMRRYRAKQL